MSNLQIFGLVFCAVCTTFFTLLAVINPTTLIVAMTTANWVNLVWLITALWVVRKGSE